VWEKVMDVCGKTYRDCCVLFLYVFGFTSIVVEDTLVQNLQGLSLCTVGTVVYPAGGDCVGGNSSVVTGWGRTEGEVKIGERVDEKGRKSNWE
jgi:hypothetical protein